MFCKNNIQKMLQNSFPTVTCLYDVSLAQYTTMKVGGVAPIFIMPDDVESMVSILAFLDNQALSYFILGKGSNLIINDKGMEIVVVSTINMNKIYLDPEDSTKIVSESGANLSDLSLFAQKNSLTGLEFSCGIPGSVGGAVFMNAGAYGGEIKDVLLSSEIFVSSQGRIIKSNYDHKFSYRRSVFSSNKCCILKAIFQLKQGNKAEITEKIDTLNQERKSKQPLDMPSSGSIFKRPEGHFVGPLICQSGLQGYVVGNAEISLVHAGFIVNKGFAKATDISQLIIHIQKTIKEKFGVILEPEVTFLEPDGSLRKFTEIL